MSSQPTTLTHPETIMEKKKYSFGRQFAKFLSKIFWHFNQQSVPPYSSINEKNSISSLQKSMKKHRSKSSKKNSSLESYYIRSQYPAIYRTCIMRERTSTLSSIPEE